MDVRQLKYFVTIVDSCSLSKAAERLFVAQPSLSQQILNLEAELKAQLLIRSPQGVAPTEAGKALYRLSRDVLRRMDQIRQEVQDGGGSESGTVAIGFPTTIASVLAAPLFQRVRQKYPGIRLQIFESMSGYITELLANGRLDLAILFRDTESLGVSVHPLFDEDLYVVGHPVSKLCVDDEVCPLKFLGNVPLVTPGPTNGLRLLIERTFSRADVDLNIVADIDSLPTMLDIAESGVACTVLPASALARRHFNNRPPIRKIVDPGMNRPASLCWNNAVPTIAATQVVRSAMIELIAELHGAGEWQGIKIRLPVVESALESEDNKVAERKVRRKSEI
ncbi:LysR substrate-binding domain-containing protein [Paraburkholderia phymatum]|uniref:Transcriptional regulator, LysR family n=1 Tax=Paraburkholderia phymatum (strain DSM 17167 / CIP 108236 / LMG 21445 / STM815) TaxID=391038 RepID=B2JL76_PARP8|nr:LysR substrate-binding domain-containing protein [Paraburkholderia phymatum]ACC74044.1 transcriptional regulator, LysR family [Paraburkholderia phymatum STM815]